MRESKTQPLQTSYFMHGFEQLHKRSLVVDLRKFVTAIKIHDLPEQGDLLDSLCDERAHFAHNLGNRAAAFRSACLRHNAKSTMHVAALHDGNEGRRLLWSERLFANRFLRPNFFCDIDNRKSRIVHATIAFSFQRMLHILRATTKFLRAHDKLDM